MKIETLTSVISFDPKEGFLRVTVKPNCDMKLSHAKFDMQESGKLVNGRKIPVFVDGRNMADHDKEVRDYYASSELAERISAMAIIVDSISTRIIGNFFIKINKPHFPTRLFDKQVSAELWLNEVINQHHIDKFLAHK